MPRQSKDTAGKDAPKASGKSAVDADVIRELAGLLDETGLTEIEIERGGLRVRVARGGGVSHFVGGAPAYSAAPAAPVAVAIPVVADPGKHPGVVASPMVGTAYMGAAPGAKPFVDIGSKVLAGDTLMIIEAMKTMNQIPAPRTGTVTQILIEDAQPVEYGEPLMIIE
jgi:acetyl-CoA carboxylase biotin carboxyl carrier protein